MAVSVTRCDGSVFRINWITQCRRSADLVHADIRLGHLMPDASALVLSCATYVTTRTTGRSSSVAGERHVCDVQLRLHKGRLVPGPNDGNSIDNQSTAIRESEDLMQIVPSAAWAVVNDCKSQYLARCFASKSWQTNSFHVAIRRCPGGHAPNHHFKLEIRLWMQYLTGATGEHNHATNQGSRGANNASDGALMRSPGEANAQAQFADLLIKQTKCDVTFRLADGSTFGAHSSILAARSPVFGAMLRHKRPTHAIAVDEDIELPVLQQLLHYVYTGKRCAMTLDERTAKQLILAADKYHIDDLIDECTRFLESRVKADNAIELLSWANRHAVARLKEAALDFIVRQSRELHRTSSASS